MHASCRCRCAEEGEPWWLAGRIVTSPGVPANSNSKAGEATRCRRARTSCRRRTCGHLRFVIGQCAAGRSPTCTPRMRQGGQLSPAPLAGDGREGAANLQLLVQGLPAEEIVWGRAGQPRVRTLFALSGHRPRDSQKSCQARGGAHTVTT